MLKVFGSSRIGLKTTQGARLRRRTTVAATEGVRRVRVARREPDRPRGSRSRAGLRGRLPRIRRAFENAFGWRGYGRRRGRARGVGGRGAVDSGSRNGARRDRARGRRFARRGRHAPAFRSRDARRGSRAGAVARRGRFPRERVGRTCARRAPRRRARHRRARRVRAGGCGRYVRRARRSRSALARLPRARLVRLCLRESTHVRDHVRSRGDVPAPRRSAGQHARARPRPRSATPGTRARRTSGASPSTSSSTS